MRLELARLSLDDVDDPVVYAALPLGEWLDTDQGRYCKEHFTDLTYSISPNVERFGYTCVITAMVDPGPALSQYLLKWPSR